MTQLHAAPARILISTLFTLTAAAAQAQPAAALSRGELLYSTHCIECHNAQMHWRTNKQASDWNTLRAQVRRWQGTARLGWSESDIDEVARHLNDSIYHYPLPGQRAGRD